MIVQEDYHLEVIRQTEKALQVKTPKDKNDKGFWLPKSQVEIDQDYSTLQPGDFIDIYIPEWLAQERGLI